VKTFLMIIVVSLILGIAFTGSSYFVTREEDVFTLCDPGELAATDFYIIKKQVKNGFPEYFNVSHTDKEAAKCQSTEGVDLSDGMSLPVEADGFYKVNFVKDMAIYSAAFFVIGGLLFGVRKKQS
jgi:hypothetical protein